MRISDWQFQTLPIGIFVKFDSQYLMTSPRTLFHPAGTSEISDLCGNVSNFGFNVSQWAEVDIASFPKKRNENPEISA